MQETQLLIATPVIPFTNYADDFVWDFFLHTPILTPAFVANKFGIDLISFAGSEAQASRMLTTLAKVAKDYLFSRLPMRSRDFQEFRLSRDLGLLYNYLEYQSAFVIAAVNTGSIYDLYNLTKGTDIAKYKPYITGLESAVALAAVKFRVSSFEVVPASLLRVGY